MWLCPLVCVCVCVRERERERQTRFYLDLFSHLIISLSMFSPLILYTLGYYKEKPLESSSKSLGDSLKMLMDIMHFILSDSLKGGLLIS